MPRPMWKGAISFSLVHLPVSLYPAARSQSLDLDLLDRRDFSPVGFRRYNKRTDRTVEWKDVVKGYQYRKGDYVVLTDEDFRRANVKASQTIDILEFVDADAVPPYFFETPYFVVPEARAGKVYRLLHDVLQKTRRQAIATVVMRTRQNLVALMPVGDLLVMNTLRYASELLPAVASDALEEAPRPTTREMQMAERLVASMSGAWEPGKYHDTYIEDLKKRIAEKVKAGKGRELTAPSRSRKRPVGGKGTDLMALLEQSLSGRSEAAPPSRKRQAAPRRARAARKPSQARRRRAA